MSSGVLLFNEPLKNYWEQKEDQRAAGLVADSKGAPAATESLSEAEGSVKGS